MEDEEAGADEERTPGRLSKRVKVWLSVAASAAGVLAGVLLVVDRWGPKEDFTLADWQKEANATCASTENFSAAFNTHSAILQLSEESDSLAGDQFKSRREAVANQVTQLADKAQKGESDLNKIKRPKGYEQEVDELIKSLEDGSTMLFQLAYDLRGTLTPSEVKTLYEQWQEDVAPVGERQRDSFESLGAMRCVVDST
ncbi:hypothetical protein [Streptomyces sp. NPDC048581]|uniref:hypothetical protein n=1 Tax=unclassified Streptomyces TaxID=2593676 RepID=UPI00371E29D3